MGSTLTVVRLVDHVGRAIVAASDAPGERSLSTRVDLAVEDVGDSIAGLLAWDTSPDDGGHVLMIIPGLDQDGTNSVHDDDGVVALRGDSVDKSVAIVPKCEVVTVALIAIEDDITFASVCVREDNAGTFNLLGTVSEGSDLSGCGVVEDALDRATVAENLSLDSLEGSDKVREIGYTVVSVLELHNG